MLTHVKSEGRDISIPLGSQYINFQSKETTSFFEVTNFARPNLAVNFQKLVDLIKKVSKLEEIVHRPL